MEKMRKAAAINSRNMAARMTKVFFDLRPILPMVPCPTLALYPDRSAIFDVEQSVAFYRHLARGEPAVFPKCGHNTYEQRPRTIRERSLILYGGAPSGRTPVFSLP
jgi:pimeloyl-ACP methyl ester carboxylesterase